jgi:hypothetical protein
MHLVKYYAKREQNIQNDTFFCKGAYEAIKMIDRDHNFSSVQKELEDLKEAHMECKGDPKSYFESILSHTNQPVEFGQNYVQPNANIWNEIISNIIIFGTHTGTSYAYKIWTYFITIWLQ